MTQEQSDYTEAELAQLDALTKKQKRLENQVREVSRQIYEIRRARHFRVLEARYNLRKDDEVVMPDDVAEEHCYTPGLYRIVETYETSDGRMWVNLSPLGGGPIYAGFAAEDVVKYKNAK